MCLRTVANEHRHQLKITRTSISSFVKQQTDSDSIRFKQTNWYQVPEISIGCLRTIGIANCDQARWNNSACDSVSRRMSYEVSVSATCPEPYLGPSLAQTCPGSQFLTFMTLLDTFVRGKEEISQLCERVRPIDPAGRNYDFIVIGGEYKPLDITGTRSWSGRRRGEAAPRARGNFNRAAPRDWNFHTSRWKHCNESKWLSLNDLTRASAGTLSTTTSIIDATFSSFRCTRKC